MSVLLIILIIFIVIALIPVMPLILFFVLISWDCHRIDKRFGKYKDEMHESIERGEFKYFPCKPDKYFSSPKKIAKLGGIKLPRFEVVKCEETGRNLNGDYMGTMEIRFDSPIGKDFTEAVRLAIHKGNTHWEIGQNLRCCLLVPNINISDDTYWSISLTQGLSTGTITYGRT